MREVSTPWGIQLINLLYETSEKGEAVVTQRHKAVYSQVRLGHPDMYYILIKFYQSPETFLSGFPPHIIFLTDLN